ncbi:MAG TPA: FGGY family carbohydrate kinase [Thermoleophilaceae bacterium]
MSSEYVIGCDVGSQGTNAALYTAGGELVDSAYEPYDVSFPHPGWAEQDAGLWDRAIRSAVRRLVDGLDGPAGAIRAISFGSQLDGQVPIDGSGRALRPCLIWMDRRAEAQAQALAETISPQRFYELSGANLDSSHGVFKVLWVRDEEPDVFASARHFVTPGTYAVWTCSGELCVDPSNGSSAALLDPRTREWSDELLAATGLDASLMVPVCRSTEPVGKVTGEFAGATGLDRSTLVVAGCGDEMAATLGAGVRAEGEVCDVVGTAEPVCASSAEPHADPTMLVECHPHADPDSWLMENPGFVSGGNLRWFRDQLGGLERAVEDAGGGDAYDLLCREASHVAPGADGLVFLPCMQGAMAPEWNGAARGVFYGLTLAHTRAHMCRALLEGSAFALRDILEAMDGAGLEPRRLTIVGGGAKGQLWRQIKADVTGLPVRVPESVETTAGGAAVLAAVGAGLYPSCAEAADSFVRFRPDEEQPDEEARAVYERAYALYREVYSAAKPVFDRDAGDAVPA